MHRNRVAADWRDFMSRVICVDQFLPVEKIRFLSTLGAAGLESSQFDVSKMEISPPLMPGNVTALVTMKLASSAIAFSDEDAAAGSWVTAFGEDLAAGRFGGQETTGESESDPDLLASRQA